MTFRKLVIFTDGASRGNPGPAGIGVVIKDEGGRVVDTISQCLGNATNNQAEYRAIIAGLEQALALGAASVELRSDSELVVHQLSGKYKVKNEALKPLFQKAEELCRRLSAPEVNYIPREKNIEADRLANQALDDQEKRREPGGVLNIAVRAATKSDYPALLEFLTELERQHLDGVPQVFREESLPEKVHDLDSIFADERDALLMAERDRVAMGYIHFSIIEAEKLAMLKPRRYVKIRDLVIGKKDQRSGAGRALMKAAEDWARERGIDTIELNVWEFNREAYSFYQKVGYTTTSRHMWKKI